MIRLFRVNWRWFVALTLVGAGSVLFADVRQRAPRAAKNYDFTRLTEYAEQAWKKAELPGAALLVYQDGQVIYEKFFGAYDETTQVPIASASKWLSAAVLMSLVDEGKLDLHAPVSKYLPAFTGRKGTLTLRQMFSHTSGLSDFPGEWNYGITIAEYADKMAREGELKADPGTEIRYGSAGMQLGGRIAEVVSGKGWNQLFKERIADKCEMPNTTFARTDRNRNPMLAGGAFSTLRDYGHFLEMIINQGVFKGRRVLSANAVREMQKDQTGKLPLVVASNDRMGRKSHYGLGEWIDEQDAKSNTLQVSSPGAFGFRPWINHPRRLFCVWMVQHPQRQGGQARQAAQPPAYNPWELLDLVHQIVDSANKGNKR
ncbi:MAG: serine hydrolase domain-containing protein [Blastocatellia bacterium]